MAPIDELPNDVDALKRFVQSIYQQFGQQVQQQAATIQQLQSECLRVQAAHHQAQAAHQAEIERLNAEHKAQILALLKRYYGPKAERFDPRQLLLFGEIVVDAPVNTEAVAAEAGEKLKTRRVVNRHKHGRGPLPESLERIEIEHDVDNKACPACGHERCRIGQDISEQLEYFPAEFKVFKHIRHKYACAQCERNGDNPCIERAAMPAQPIEKGLPGPSLLAYVATSKLGDHLPLYRLERIFARSDIHIARSTMCAWMQTMGELVTPLVDLMMARVRMSKVIHTDDTTVPIQDQGKCRKGRMWCYLGDEQHPYLVYDYTPNRQRAGPVEWLKDYAGYLQADAYGGYDGIYSGGKVTECACWAHARRKFYDAQETDRARATWMLLRVQELYSIEASAKSLTHAERAAVRQEQSVPILATIKEWLLEQSSLVLGRSPMSEAIGYALNQWDALCVYTAQGYLNIDNNAAERALRRVAVGRKNWMFAGHDDSAKQHARLWSLIASAERHNIDPQRYLTSVFAKLPLLTKSTQASRLTRGADGNIADADLADFLPDVWKKDDAAEPIPTA